VADPLGPTDGQSAHHGGYSTRHCCHNRLDAQWNNQASASNLILQ